MIDRQVQKELDALAKRIQLLKDDNMAITKARVAMEGFDDDYDCIDVLVNITTSKKLTSQHFIALSNVIRQIIRDDGWEEWIDVSYSTTYNRDKKEG